MRPQHRNLGDHAAPFPPVADTSPARKHIIAALVVNQPGCLAHIANLFAARGYNIDSLVVGRTELPQMSRMTVVMHASLERVEQVCVSVVLCTTRNGQEVYHSRRPRSVHTCLTVLPIK